LKNHWLANNIFKQAAGSISASIEKEQNSAKVKSAKTTINNQHPKTVQK
jgi:hypothetical protein